METTTFNFRKIASAISLLLITTYGYSQTTLTYNASGTFIVPAGVTSVQAEAWGAGGAGGGNTTSSDGAGGGGGGAYSKNASISVSSGSSHTVSVGDGGIGGTGIGGNGGDSYFSTILTLLAKGGSGGNPPLLGGAGVGGNGGSTLGVGTTKYSGGNGGYGRNSSTGHAGPGGTSAGTGSNGLSGSSSWSSPNAPLPVPAGAGAGAAGGTSGNNGVSNTSSPGGGGGGAGDKSSSNTIGGDGADGRVILTWTCPTYALTTAASNNGPVCSGVSTIVTLRSTSLPTGTYNVTYNLSGNTSATGNTATMTFTAGSPGTGTFSTSALNAGTTTVTITNLSSGSGCSTSISSFNTTNVTVNSSLPASVSVSASATTICTGTNVTFTATPTNGGTTPVYQWKLNGSNVGTNSATYSNNTLTNGNTVTCVMTSNATPCLTGSPATSNTVTMTVNAYVAASVSISASAATICAGTNVTFTATPTNGGTPSYQWKLNGANVGTNSATYSNNALANGNTVTCVMTSSVTCVTGSPATSNTVTMTVTPNVTASVSISASASTICSGTNVTFTATPTNGGTTPVYQWKLNGVNVGTNSTTYSNNALANGNTVTCVMTSNATPCVTGSPATSNTVTMTVNPTLTASVNVSASAATICVGTNVTFTATPTNGGTTPVYQWKLNGTNVGTNSTTYSNNALANGNTVTCVMTSNATPCLAGSPATSNTVTMTVNPNVTASVSISATATTTCAGITETFTATPTNGGTTPTYQWKKNGLNVGTNSPTFASSTFATGDVITCVMTSNAPCVSASPATSNALTMTVNPLPVITGTTPGSRINTGTVVLGATSNIGGVYWYGNASGGGAIGSGSSWTTYSIGVTTTFYAGAITTAGCISATRTAVVATVYNPEIDIQGNAVSIADGDISPAAADWTDFGSTNATRIFTIRNTGVAILNIGAITFSGANATDFTVTSSPASTVAIGGSTTFTVAFNPTAAGTRLATISIDNDDNNENPYDFAIQGTGIAQEITVQGNAVTIADADNTPTTADWTDFSNVTFTRTYTIQNSGNVPLTIGSIAFSGPHASEFTVTSSPVSPVPAYGSTTFTLTFSPLGVGVRVATLNIANDDSDENPYDFSIIATGVNIDSDGDGVYNGTDSDDDNDGITDVIECGSCLTDPFTNGSFEVTNPILGATTYSIMPAANVTGWQSSPENLIEIWSTGFLGVPAAQGNQFAELNANVPGTLYQTFCLNGASGTITWSIKHRGRDGVDQAFVRFGSTLADAQTNTPIATMVDGNAAWGLYSGTYIIPAGQTQIVLAFQAGYTASGSASVGNFIDDVQITINQACIDTDGDGVANIIDLDDDNDGIPDIEEAGFKAYSNNSSTFDKTNPANWKDLNTNGISDIIDTMISGGTYVMVDADADGIPNYIDLDSDNDAAFDVDEAGVLNGDGDINGDGKGDGGDTDRDGLLNLYDNTASFGTTARAYALDTNANGVADFLQLDSNADGINDIKTGLYGSLDANNDGKIDGTADIDRDGILDAFDTNTAAVGSPRNLDRKLFLDFDGRNDYGQDSAILGGLPQATLMAWIDLSSTFLTEGFIVGQNKFQLRVTSGGKLETVLNSTTLRYNIVSLDVSRWYHAAAVYDGALLKLFLNGVMVNSVAVTGNIDADASLLTLGKDPLTSTKYFKGKIDEVRVFNTALTDAQLQRMIYQEIQNTSSQVRGTIVPKDIEALPFANLLRYYRMDAYKDDIVDNLTTPSIDTGTGMKIYNHKVIKVQEAPMPFVTERTGTFATAVNSTTNDVRGLDATDFDYSIIQVKHNITDTANATDLAMFVDPGVTITMNNNTKIQNDWYLKLDGKIDLQGKSQLVQTTNSELDATSAGSIERDQQGQSNKFNYNYWSSPVGAINATTNNNAFTVAGVMRDGTNPNNIQSINWTTDYNGAATSPVTLSSYWIFKFQNLTPDYSNWSAVGQNGTLQAAQGFTMKGTAAATASQNYTFVGKPNNGTITTAIAPGNLNLCGNPYPSALDADAFIAANSSVTTGTLYFWEHYNTNTSHNLLDYQGGYAARNLVGGTPPVSPTGVSMSGTSTRIPSRFIPVGQGFLVYGSGTGGNITFNNAQRGFVKENEATSNVMFRQNNLSIIDKQFDNHEDRVVENNTFSKLRLGFNSANNYHRQILLGFMNELATDGFDPGYDASQLDTQPNDLYFAIPSKNLVIQGVGAFDSSKVLPLCLKNGLEGNVQFVLDAVENFDPNQNIFIHDNVTNEYHNIKNNAFEINLPIGTYETRFSLCFSSSALGVDDFDLSQEVIVTFTNSDNTININNNLSDATIKSVELFNMLGQSIRTWDVKNTDQTKIQIPVTNVSTGTYIVKVHTTKGDLTEKIIIK